LFLLLPRAPKFHRLFRRGGAFGVVDDDAPSVGDGNGTTDVTMMTGHNVRLLLRDEIWIDVDAGAVGDFMIRT